MIELLRRVCCTAIVVAPLLWSGHPVAAQNSPPVAAQNAAQTCEAAREEIKAWSDGVEGYRPYDDPEKKDWFADECAKVDLKPETSTLADYLDADDVVSFKS